MTITGIERWRGRRRPVGPRESRTEPNGPLTVFSGSIAITAAIWLYWLGFLPTEAMLPAICGLFVVLAIAIALTWPRARSGAAGFTYWDAAGILMLIGILAAAAVEPDHMVRLVAGDRQP
jgi:hypothetical protein